MAHMTTDPSNELRWIIIYPSYFNSRKTRQEGRKVAKEKAVDNPKVSEMKDVLQYHGINCTVEEGKQYPRDSSKDALCKGRVRVQLKNSDGTFVKEEYTSRESVIYLLCDMIPKLKSRQSKGAVVETGAKKKEKKKR